jgi:hypothetical protein
VINAKHYAPWVIDFRLPQLPARRKLLFFIMTIFVYPDTWIFICFLIGLPHGCLHMVIHGFVFLNLQNRLMSTIYKPPDTAASLLLV